MARKDNEKEILMIQHGEDECLSEVAGLEMLFTAPTIQEVALSALNAIGNAGDSFQTDEHEGKVIQLTEELERVEGGIRDLQARAERIKDNITALEPIDGSKIREMIEANLKWALDRILPDNPLGFEAVIFKSYMDDDDMNCCTAFYGTKQIERKEA